MNYLVIDPLGNSSGISSYTNYLKKELNHHDIQVEILSNKDNLSAEDFRQHVYDFVTAKYGYNDVLIEAPEAKSSTLLLPNKYKVHVRLHCPLAIAQYHDNKPVDQAELSNELRVINKATYASSPSHALLEALSDEIKTEHISVFKNPIEPKEHLFKSNSDKKYDLVFMGRMQHLKGYDYIRKILERLPEHFNVLVFGNNSHKVKLTENIKCSVDIRDQINGPEKYNLIAKSKVLMQLSRFENCSMVILESFSVGTPVCCWNAGGNAEIEKGQLIKPCTIGNINEMVHNIVSQAARKDLTNDLYLDTIQEVNNDFSNGLKTLLNDLPAYKGYNHSKSSIANVERVNQSNNCLSLVPKRIMGIAFSNEHVEELWAPIVKVLGSEYRYTSRRDIGHHHVFEKKEPCFDTKFFSQLDWIKHPERLIRQITTYRPNLIIFHNGAHPIYKEVMEMIKATDIPVIYSELGWLPQKNHVYFDQMGVNGQSKLASKTFEEMTGQQPVSASKAETRESKGPHIVATQLDNDTNIIVNSKRFKSKSSFIDYVLSQINSDEEVLIKLHPLDKKPYELDTKKHPNARLVTDDIITLLKTARSLITINSTVAVQALEFDCEVFYCGDSILDNKGVAHKFDKAELRDLLNPKSSTPSKNKTLIADALRRRQINLLDVENMKIEELVNHEGMKPFIDLDTVNFETCLKTLKKLNTPKKSNKMSRYTKVKKRCYKKYKTLRNHVLNKIVLLKPQRAQTNQTPTKRKRPRE